MNFLSVYGTWSSEDGKAGASFPASKQTESEKINPMGQRQQTGPADSLRPASIAALALVLFFLYAAPAAPQEAPQSSGTVLKVTTEAVNVYAVVRDKNRRLVPDLTKDDFEIKEDNVPQKISYFTRETDTPLTLAVMIDTSPSQERVLDV